MAALFILGINIHNNQAIIKEGQKDINTKVTAIVDSLAEFDFECVE